MSHKLFDHSSFPTQVWAFLTQVDAAEAQASREAGCPRCGCALHSATYPRKPHGLAAALRDDVRRFSLCCSVCRRRVKPPSVRFFGRRFRVAPLFLVVSALAVAGACACTRSRGAGGLRPRPGTRPSAPSSPTLVREGCIEYAADGGYRIATTATKK